MVPQAIKGLEVGICLTSPIRLGYNIRLLSVFGEGAMPRILPILFTLCAISCAYCANYGGGSGFAGDPYLISSATHLQELSSNPGDWGKCFRLVTDVDAASYSTGVSIVFAGTFDGGGHTISGLNFVTGGSYVGLFGKVQGMTARVSNLSLTAPTINVPAGNYVGGIAGSLMDGGVIRGCSVTGGTVVGHDAVGGIAGSNNGGSIMECHSTATVSGTSHVGGLVGRNEQYSALNDCSAAGNVTADDDYCGGLAGLSLGTVFGCWASGETVGHNYTGGLVGSSGDGSYAANISQSLATGKVTGATYIGGLVGSNYRGEVSQCYAWGEVTATVSNGGGLVGRNETAGTIVKCYSKGRVVGSGTTFGGLVGKSGNPTTVTYSFWDTVTSSQPTVSSGGTGKTTTEMQTLSTFSSAGWDFLGETINGTADTWRMCTEGTNYPRLSWEWPAADIICPNGVGFGDFASFAASWMLTGTNLRADFDGSGSVDAIDLSIFICDWLQ